LKNKKLAFIQKLDNVQDAISVYQAVAHYDNLYRLVMESSKEEWDSVFSICIKSIVNKNKRTNYLS